MANINSSECQIEILEGGKSREPKMKISNEILVINPKDIIRMDDES
jgi:hypothetical protein